jgi:hypothetical protein
MKHFWQHIGYFFVSLINGAKAVFAQKVCNPLIISYLHPPQLLDTQRVMRIFTKSHFHKKNPHGTFAGKTNCRMVSASIYGCLVPVQNRLGALKSSMIYNSFHICVSSTDGFAVRCK